MIQSNNGWIRKTKPPCGFTLGRKLMVLATNHLGYEVQEYRPGEGWKSAIDEVVGYTDDDVSIIKPLIWADKDLAEQAMEMLSSTHRVYKELRVYEALDYPPAKK